MLRSPSAARRPVLTGDSPKPDGSFRGGTGLFRRVPLALAVLPRRLLPRLCRPLRSADAGVHSPGDEYWRVMAAEGDAALLARCMCARALAFLADPTVGLPCSSRTLRSASGPNPGIRLEFQLTAHLLPLVSSGGANRAAACMTVAISGSGNMLMNERQSEMAWFHELVWGRVGSGSGSPLMPLIRLTWRWNSCAACFSAANFMGDMPALPLGLVHAALPACPKPCSPPPLPPAPAGTDAARALARRPSTFLRTASTAYV